MGDNANQVIPFATGVGANVLPPTTYALQTYIQQGFQNGVLEAYDLNTVLRQASFVSAMIAQFTADYGPQAFLDDGNLGKAEANFVAALHELFVGIPDVLDTGTANTIIINPQPGYSAYAVPMAFFIKVKFTNVLLAGNGATTINVSGLGPRPLIIPDGSQLLPGDVLSASKILVSYEATSNSFMLMSPRGTEPTPKEIIHWGLDVSLIANQVVIATDSTIVSYETPTFFAVYIGNSNTNSSVTFSANTIGNVPITRGAGGALAVNDLIAGTVAFLCFDGTEAQLLNPQQLGSSTSGAPANWSNIVGPLAAYWLATKSAVVTAPPVSPASGDAYIVPTGATGVWSGNAGKITQWDGTTSAWVFRTYPIASIVATSDTAQFWKQTGTAWQEVIIPTPGKLFFLAQL